MRFMPAERKSIGFSSPSGRGRTSVCMIRMMDNRIIATLRIIGQTPGPMAVPCTAAPLCRLLRIMSADSRIRTTEIPMLYFFIRFHLAGYK